MSILPKVLTFDSNWLLRFFIPARYNVLRGGDRKMKRKTIEIQDFCNGAKSIDEMVAQLGENAKRLKQMEKDSWRLRYRVAAGFAFMEKK